MKDIAKINTNKKCDENSISCINNMREKRNIFKNLNRNILNFNNSNNDKYMNYIYNSTNVTYGKNYKRINKKDVHINNILLHTYKQHKKKKSTIISSDNNNNNNNNNAEDDISSRKLKFKDIKGNTKQKYINDHNNINSYDNNINNGLINEHKNVLHNECKNKNNQIIGYSIKYDKNVVSENSCSDVITSLKDKKIKKRKKKLQKKKKKM
ncbi:hypothetical protein PFFCH_04520 [Plasmodium falciparum FCH/4]|uniref:Uncharacterized protein n=1 Tax=Plasmodium falciparum FCH/4 TaxID=1036724 RepID=A0A024VHK1_PLAFA|nr:hypothetical protein PFFCH_04520 [Plasmodium falciparum FCH/4]